MAEFYPFAAPIKVRIHMIMADPSAMASTLTTFCQGYDPSGNGSYWIGTGSKRSRFWRVGGAEVTAKDVRPTWRIDDDDLANLPAFMTNKERQAEADRLAKAATPE
jgi:hypothetical protein